MYNPNLNARDILVRRMQLLKIPRIIFTAMNAIGYIAAHEKIIGVIRIRRGSLIKNKLRHLDLFSGIGGFSLGLEATGGFETVAFCEIEEFPRQVLQKHWPHIKQYKDIKELTYDKLKADEIGPIDIITGGYPCQPFSVAGNKKGVEDPRHLWPEYFRLVKECRPSFVIGENVSGHLKLGLDSVLTDLESEGYTTRTFSISASSIGANHQRERVWIVAHSERNDNFNKEQRVNGEESSLQEEYRENDSTTRNSSRASTVRETSNKHANVEDTRRRSWREQFTGNKESTGRGASEKTEWSSNTNKITGSSEGAETLANTESFKGNVREDSEHTSTGNGQREAGRESSLVANTDSERGRSRQTRSEDAENVRQSPRSEKAVGWWDIEPDVGRVAHGVSDRTHRLKALGNSLIPHIPYYIGLSILEVHDA
tara:strand:- start:1588 stop:2868 length:1281 start_codon:yes stop_codon:yes gene_type:complete